MTDLQVYDPSAQLEQYQPRMTMTPESAKALDEQVRLCTRAVLREGVDYGIIPGTNGEKTLYRPGAQKLMQWFGYGFTCERTEVERDEDGRKHGITYRAAVGPSRPDGTIQVKATCEGTADYDESKFYQTAEQVQRKAETAERRFAEKDKRPPRPTRWQGLPEYRADWNSLMKRAQKRAIVGAVIDATAAGGIFADREEDDHAPPSQDDGPSWTEAALAQIDDFTEVQQCRELYSAAAEAHKQGLCNRKQQDLVQNTAAKRARKLQAAVVVDVEDLGRQAAAGEEDQDPAGTEPDDLAERHRKLVGAVQGEFKRLGFSDDDRDERLWAAGKLAGVSELQSLNDLDPGELKAVAGALGKCRDRERLESLLALTGEGGETNE